MSREMKDVNLNTNETEEAKTLDNLTFHILEPVLQLEYRKKMAKEPGVCLFRIQGKDFDSDKDNITGLNYKWERDGKTTLSIEIDITGMKPVNAYKKD